MARREGCVKSDEAHGYAVKQGGTTGFDSSLTVFSVGDISFFPGPE